MGGILIRDWGIRAGIVSGYGKFRDANSPMRTKKQPISIERRRPHLQLDRAGGPNHE